MTNYTRFCRLPQRSLKDTFSVFLEAAEEAGADRAVVERVSVEMHRFYSMTEAARSRTEIGARTERWYRSLASGHPDYTVYDGDEYLGELWSCWAVYSRGYLRALSLTPSPGPGLTGRLLLPGSVAAVVAAQLPRRVVDLGCGFGFTTAGLVDMFPTARVVGTNLPGTVQDRLARLVGRERGFTVVGGEEGVGGRAEVVFASEYFEHHLRPVDHLDAVLSALHPDVLLVANAFGTRGLGHFHNYYVAGRWVSGAEASGAFADRLRAHGYRQVRTGLWNNRPTLWVAAVSSLGVKVRSLLTK